MRKSIVSSYLQGLRDKVHGESYQTILRYFFPEFITALVLYSALSLLDARFIAALKSTTAYATVGMANNMLHFITKIAEAMAISITILGGQYNGAGQFKEAGHSFVDAFWVIFLVGFIFSASLYFGAYYIYAFMGVTPKMIVLGIPYMRVRAIGVFLMCLYFACISFIRGLKNTQTPMYIFFVGGALFIVFDYVLIFGVYGFPHFGLLGSAYATLIQYGAMLLLGLAYIIFNKSYKPYAITLLKPFTDWSYAKHVFNLSWPIVLDKATVAGAYIWLAKMIAPMGKYAMATFTVVKDMERFSFLPAIAFAQIITFLVSNDFGKKNWPNIAANIKKVIFLTSLMVFTFLVVLSIRPDLFVTIFDQKHKFTEFAAHVFPLISIFVFFDLLQLILAAALRGAGDVRIVMWVRLFVCIGIFCPLSYLFSQLTMQDQILKFVLIYATFYVGSGIMSLVYIRRFRSGLWSQQDTGDLDEH